MDINIQKIEVITSGYEYLGRLVNGIEQIVEFLRAGEVKRASDLISELIEGLAWLIDALVLTQDIQVERIDISVCRELLERVVESFKNQDYVLLSDLFDYELIPLLIEWKEKLGKTIEKQ